MSDTFDTPTAPPLAPERWAQVRVAEHVTRYLRRGIGHPVVVVGMAGADPSDADPGLWPALFPALAERYRVIVPEVPATDAAEFALWIGGFLDGVGLPPATLIAAGRFCLPALELALNDAGRLTGLVLVPGGGADESVLAAAHGDAARDRNTVPVLIVRRGQQPVEALAQVERFVARQTA